MMEQPSPAPWSFAVEGGVDVIRDANGITVHSDDQYYPSGLATEDAKFIVEAVNAYAQLKAAAVALAHEYQQGQFSGNHPEHGPMWDALIAALGPAADLPDPSA